MLSGDDLTSERIAGAVSELRESAGANLDDARAEVVYGMRYAGQAFELDVPGPVDPDPADLIARFEETHESRYGHRDPESEVVLVDIRLALVLDGPGRDLGMTLSHEQRGGSFGSSPDPSDGSVDEGSRPVHFDGEWLDTPVLRGEPKPGRTASGPVVFELPEATLVLPPSWSARVDEFGSILATRLTGESGDPGRTSLFVREGSPDSPAPEHKQ
jgi:N-methylhydantoinase A